MRGILIGTGLAAILAAGLWLDHQGYARGHAAAERAAEANRARLQAEIDTANSALADRARELETERAARAALAMEIEDEARADPAASSRRPSADSLHRLSRRWGAPAR